MLNDETWNLNEHSIKIELNDPDDFNKVRETLTRIGIPSKEKNQLVQSCHILHKKGKYFILHFKELFLLDGRQSEISDEDEERRNLIAQLLEDWNLVKIINKEILTKTAYMNKIKIIPFKEKDNWNLVAKYSIGSTK